MLSMKNVSKVFRTELIETHALRNFSLEVKAGEFLAVTGPSGSGKTTVVRRIVDSLGDAQVTVIEHDRYYRDRNDLRLEERAALNYDHPDSLETDLLVGHLHELRAGRAIDLAHAGVGGVAEVGETALAFPDRRFECRRRRELRSQPEHLEAITRLLVKAEDPVAERVRERRDRRGGFWGERTHGSTDIGTVPLLAQRDCGHWSDLAE